MRDDTWAPALGLMGKKQNNYKSAIGTRHATWNAVARVQTQHE